MITHVVLVKLKNNAPQNLESTRTLLESMNGKISSMRHLEVGTNVGSSDRAYDVSLIAKFVNLDGLRAYEQHPIHLPISKNLREVASSIAVVDYESK
jgi:hypothetical protein